MCIRDSKFNSGRKGKSRRFNKKPNDKLRAFSQLLETFLAGDDSDLGNDETLNE